MSTHRSSSPLAADAASGMRFGVVRSRFNDEVTRHLRDGALASLAEHGADASAIVLLDVPGAFELPMAALRLARSGRVDAVVCVGALIRGETSHYDVLAHSTAIGMLDVVRDTGIPIANGLLTCETLEQAMERAGGAVGNKGAEAAEAAIEMVLRFREIGGD